MLMNVYICFLSLQREGTCTERPVESSGWMVYSLVQSVLAIYSLTRFSWCTPSPVSLFVFRFLLQAAQETATAGMERLLANEVATESVFGLARVYSLENEYHSTRLLPHARKTFGRQGDSLPSENERYPMRSSSRYFQDI
jgi:hypothetical protein